MAYYHGLISSRRANSLLTSRSDGTFLIRDSQSQPGSFVLSAKNGGRMYHVLIFQRAEKFHLDSAGEQSEDPAIFDTMDEMVSFLIGHDLKVDGDEIHLQEILPCDDELRYRVRVSSNAASRGTDTEDSDQLTDLFATLFGTHCVVICTAHSKLTVEGKPLGDGKQFIAVIAKDGKQKGFFIRLVDYEAKCVVGEKKIGKAFQYDLPGDLVMAYLSEHGLTCIGFRDTQEKDRFLHQIDRIVKLHQDRAVKLRGRADSSAKQAPTSPTEVSHKMKASDFNIHDISPEWQYLFDQAGVTQEMLEDKKTLQFILDTVFKIGGEPEKIDDVLEVTGAQSNGTVKDQDKERVEALTLDANLKRETMRASKLSEELMKSSLKKDTSHAHSHVCSYLALCERFKDHLVVKHSMISLSPENAVCICENCAQGKPMVQIAGSPPQQYSLPLGWCQFIHKSQTHKFSQRFSSHWHVGYCCVPSSKVAGIFRTGQLLHSHSTGKVLLSPDIGCACKIATIAPEKFHDKATDQHFRVHAVFQVFIQPGTYSVQVAENPSSSTSPLNTQLEWHVSEKTYIIHSLLIQMTPA